MLCPSCRRQVTRGVAFCGSCGRAARVRPTPPLELVLAERRRACRSIGELVIGRAPASRSSSTTRASRARTRGSRLGNGHGALIEDAGSSHGTFLDGASRDRAGRAARRRADPARRPGAGRRAPARLGRGRAHDRRPAGRQPGGRPRPGRGGGAAGDAVRHAAARALRLRAQAPRRRRGLAPLGARATCTTDSYLRLSRQRRRSCSSCSTASTRCST